MTADVLFLSNGHGEDTIAARLIDSLIDAGLPVQRINGWAMVGKGEAYKRLGIHQIGPPNLLPSEGFGTLSAGLFLRDLRAGWIGTHRAQIGFARSLRGRFRLMVAVGDVVPLTAAALAGTPRVFVSCAKSAHYGGRDGHGAIERILMRRCRRVFARDALTAQRLTASGVASLHVGNPMMDGLTPDDPDRYRVTGMTGVLLLPGSRGDATRNALFLLDCLPGDGRPLLGLMPCTGAVDLDAVQKALTSDAEQGWTVLVAAPDRLDVVHTSGARALLLRNGFADLLHGASMAVGMAGTANEQAVGMGLPLIVVPGAGNQGAAYVRMKRRWYGAAARHVDRHPGAVSAALRDLRNDPAAQADMREAGAVRMGAPGGSDLIARAIRAELDLTPHA